MDKNLSPLPFLRGVAVITIVIISALFFLPGQQVLAKNPGGGALNLSEMPEYILGGHSDTVRATAWSPGQEIFASGGADGNIILWEAETGRIHYVLSGHTNSLNALKFSPEGDFLASAGADGTVRIWNINSLEEEMTLSDHTDWVTDLDWSPEGDYLVSSSWDRTVRIWDTVSGESITTFDDFTGWVRAVSWSPEGNMIAIGEGQEIRIRDLETEEIIAEISESYSRGRITALSWSPEGDLLAAGDDSGTARIIITEDWSLQESFDPAARAVNSLKWAPDGSLLAVSGDHREISLFSLVSGEEKRLKGHGEYVRSLSWSPAGDKLITGSRDRSIRVWSLEDLAVLYSREGHTGMINSLQWAPDGSYLASGSEDNTIRLWQPPQPDSKKHLRGHINPVEDIAWSPDSGILASASQDEAVIVWDPGELERMYIAGDNRRIFRTDIFLPRGREKTTHEDWVFSVSWSPSGEFLASASYDGKVGIWRAEDGSRVEILEHESGWVRNVCWTSTDNELISGGESGGIHVWSIEGDLLDQFGSDAGQIRNLSWETNQQELLASSHYDHSIRLWDYASREELNRISETGIAFDLAWAPTGNYLAAALENRSFKIWRLANKELVEEVNLKLPGFTSLSPRAISWSPDQSLLVVNDGNYILIWELE